MTIDSEAAMSNCYDIKSADLSLVALVLKTTDIQAISRALLQQMAESPGFFEQDPVIVDVSFIDIEQHPSLSTDLVHLLSVLREHALMPVAVKGAQGGAFVSCQGIELGGRQRCPHSPFCGGCCVC